MRSKWRRAAAVLGTGLALVIAGCGGSQQATTQASTGSQQNAPAQGGSPFTSANLTTLASTLGVSKAKLQTALEAARPSGSRPASGGPDEMAAALAKQLDLSESKVQAALAKVMPHGGQPPAQPSSSEQSLMTKREPRPDRRFRRRSSARPGASPTRPTAPGRASAACGARSSSA